MFEIKIIASNSKGNCYVIRDGSSRILIDPGINIREIQKALNFEVSAVDFVLLSHEHGDHSKAVPQLLRMGKNIYMSAGTRKALGIMHSSALICSDQLQFEHSNWTILPFETIHDAQEPLGFLIRSPSGKKILYATDTYYISYSFVGITHYMIECNYSNKLLSENARLPEYTKQRIRTTHFELQNVKNFLFAQDLSTTEVIYLIHLSDDNSDEKMFVKEIEEITGKPVIIR